MTQQDAQASNTVVTGTLPIHSFDVKVLIDFGPTHSFVSYKFAEKFKKTPEPLNCDLSVATPLGDFVIIDCVFKHCVIRVGDRELSVDLVLLDIRDFDVILGMD